MNLRENPLKNQSYYRLFTRTKPTLPGSVYPGISASRGPALSCRPACSEGECDHRANRTQSRKFKKKIGQIIEGIRQESGISASFGARSRDSDPGRTDDGTRSEPTGRDQAFDQRTGKKETVLLSTHIMQEVEAICDRVIIINQGKIVADRPIGEICTHADEGMVLRVEFSPGSDTHWLSKSELFTHTSQQAPNCWRLTSPQGKDPREALFFEAAVRRCPIIALHTEVYQLEDIFHRYTQNFPAKPEKD